MFATLMSVSLHRISTYVKQLFERFWAPLSDEVMLRTELWSYFLLIKKEQLSQYASKWYDDKAEDCEPLRVPLV